MSGIVLRAVALLLAAALGLLLLYLLRTSGQPSRDVPRDPRRDYAGPFRNVDPDVHYVAEERCADCHPDEARTYAEHPMGRSLQTAAQAPMPPMDAGHHNPFDALGSRFTVGHDGGRAWQRRAPLDPADKPAAEQEWDVHYVIGSGTRGYSFLTDRAGFLFQTPVSWYSQKQLWDLSPGFGPTTLTGRAVLPDCLFCHANQANHLEGSENHYQEPVFRGHAIGCQRCHGPAELHVAGRDGAQLLGPDKIDPTIVNPRHLERPLRDAVCEQCHLVGKQRVTRRGRELYDFRPGLPLESFLSIFIRGSDAADGPRAVGQVELMYQSRCFQGSDLGCVSCHNPHEQVQPARRVAHYRDRCLKCHQKQGCSLPLADRLRRTAEDSCIDCHMPRYDAPDIAHTAATDHRIPRNSKVPARLPASPAAGGDGLPLVSFYRDRKGTEPAEQERDLAVALVKLAVHGEAASARALGRALPMLGSALERDPDDLAAGEAKAYALALQSHWTESLTAFETVLAKAPHRELALVGAASMAEASGMTDSALGYWQRAVVDNPWMPEYRRPLVLLLIKKQAWQEARPECEAWIRLDPTSVEARVNRILCLLSEARKDEARVEFARIEALAPENLRELQARFQKKLR